MDRNGSPSREPIHKPTGTGDGGGPGTYDPAPQYDFGKEVKSFTIGEKRLEKVEYDHRDYSPERGETMTKPRLPNTVDMGRNGSPSRAPIAKPTGTGDGGGPGTYDPAP